MITADEYLMLLGVPPPDDFSELLKRADGEVNRATLYGLIGRDPSIFPDFVQQELNLAYAYQIQYLSDNADTINGDSIQSFTLGKFSVSAGMTTATSDSTRALSPLSISCLATVNAYLRGLRA